jgi:hypothetical protein
VNNNARWVLDGSIEEDAGSIGGDIQVGPAISARFRSSDCPEARFEVAAYATAKPYMELDEQGPVCPHELVILESYGDGVARFAPMPEGHMACSWKPGTVDVQAQFTFRRNGRIENGTYESDDSDLFFYEYTGSDVGYRAETFPEEIKAATRDAKTQIEGWVRNINTYLYWDGRTIPQG